MNGKLIWDLRSVSWPRCVPVGGRLRASFEGNHRLIGLLRVPLAFPRKLDPRVGRRRAQRLPTMRRHGRRLQPELPSASLVLLSLHRTGERLLLGR